VTSGVLDFEVFKAVIMKAYFTLCLLHADLFALLFIPEDGDGILLRNVSLRGVIYHFGTF
jgi:hypothetical protein